MNQFSWVKFFHIDFGKGIMFNIINNLYLLVGSVSITYQYATETIILREVDLVCCCTFLC